MNNDRIKVWDIGVRIFHWTLVLGFTIAWFSGEESELLHSWSGYTVLGLLIFRIIWGLVGTRHARFSNFIYSPTRIIGYLKSLKNGRPEHYLGHNPAGGLMVILLLVNLLLVSWTGLEAWGAEGNGPLAQTVGFSIVGNAVASSGGEDRQAGKTEADEEYWEELHEFFSNVMLILIAVHIAGVLISSRLHGENLVKAMITGYKSKSRDGSRKAS